MNIHNLIKLRQTLHRKAELSGAEEQTAEIILQWLQQCKPDRVMKNVGGHGILAIYEGKEKGPEVLIRGDMDALPIEEVNEISYKSENPGVAHLCGHDGHMTILCGLAAKLTKERPKKGRVILLFQPAEEIGEGARKMIEDPSMEPLKPDFVFALHNIPGYPLNSVIVKEGSFSAAVNSIIIKLKGKTAHAAEPENGINPALAMAQILNDCKSLENPDTSKSDMRIITPVYAVLGDKAYGTSAGYAEVHFTLRCWDNDNLHKLEKEVEGLASKIAQTHELGISTSYTQTFFANENDADSVEYVRKAANHHSFEIIYRNSPFKWGEDFGIFTSRFKGCMFGLGAGESQPALHNPDYDFPDELIESGVKIFSQIINELNG